ncbi:hypothetical protein [Sphaerisporangium aureirubrum]|uniref:Uncharacterized protein n=1 Tax=Sphaerisporangium aureirubrum TaxID=1544736 RepID=A0ABW1NGZ2_9ACTN
MSRAWAVAAATEATRVPAIGPEAAAWRTRGWAEIALGGLALATAHTEDIPLPATPFHGLDGTPLADTGLLLSLEGATARGTAEALATLDGAAARRDGAAGRGVAEVLLEGAAGRGVTDVLHGLDGAVVRRMAEDIHGLDGGAAQEVAEDLDGLGGAAAPGAVEVFRGLDEVVRRVGIRYAGRHATRLRALRALAGPVPAYYLTPGRSAHPGGPCAEPGLSGPVGEACRAIGEFCDAVAEACPGEPSAGGNREGAAADLRWGERHRPSPCGGYTIVRADRCAGLAGRCWMRLPSACGPRDVFVDVPRRAAPVQERIWRGVHEGAHLDHMAMTSAGIEFGYGLLAAEAYAMAVEVLATVSCLLAGELDEARWLRAGLVERIGRLPGYAAWLATAGQVPAALRDAAALSSPDLAPLPRLAAVYVRGPLLLLGGHDLGPLAPYLPPSLTDPLLDRWSTARTAFPPAAALTPAPRRPHR